MMWCGACSSAASQAQSKQSTYGSRGFQYLEILVENRSASSVSSTEQMQWASSASMTTIPVLNDSSKAVLFEFEQNWRYPSIVHLAAGTMQVLDIDNGTSSPASWL